MAAPFEQQVVFVAVDDLDRSAAFYEGVLQMELTLDQGNCRIYRSAGGAYVGICLKQGVAPIEGMILTLVSHDVDGWAARLLAAGVAIQSGPRRNEQFNIYHLYTKDPDGNTVEIQEFLDPAWPRVEPA